MIPTVTIAKIADTHPTTHPAIPRLVIMAGSKMVNWATVKAMLAPVAKKNTKNRFFKVTIPFLIISYIQNKSN